MLPRIHTFCLLILAGYALSGCEYTVTSDQTDYKGDVFGYTSSQLDPSVEATAGAKAVVLGDINNDGLMDIVSISGESQPVQIHLRNAALGVYDQISIAGGAPLSRMNRVKLADLNADGKLDIVVLVNDTGFVPPEGTQQLGALVLLIQGADPRNPADWRQVDAIRQVNPTINCFATPLIPQCSMFFGTDTTGVVDVGTGDFTGDGLPDIVVLSNEFTSGDNGRSAAYILPNPGAANVADPALWIRTPIEIDANPMASVSVADVDGDSDPDVVMSAPTSKSFNLRWIRNVNHAAAWSRELVGQQQNGGELISVGDIDGDGDVDVAASSTKMGLTQWFRNPGPAYTAVGTPQVPWDVFNIIEFGTITINGQPADTLINQVQLVDLDGNGTLDCYVTASGTAYEFQRETDTQSPWRWTPIFTTNPTATIGESAFLDVNGDGRKDVIAPLDREGLPRDQLLIFYR